MKHAVLGLVTFLVLAGIVLLVGYWQEVNEFFGRKKTDKELAYESCTKAVTKALKAPSTAKWPSFDDPDVHVSSVLLDESDPRSEGLSVEAYVDAQNAFGAMIRNRVSCAVKHNGAKWVTVWWKIHNPELEKAKRELEKAKRELEELKGGLD